MKAYVSLFFLSCCLLFSNQALAKIELEINPKEVVSGESFELIFTHHGNDSSPAPDFSPLEKDFHLLSAGKSTHVSVINGQLKAKTQWALTLITTKAGRYTIPAINFGAEQSEPRRFSVKPSQGTAHSQKEAPSLFMRATIEQGKHYVQQGLIYTIKLYSTKRLISGRFTSPSIDNALLMQLGESKSSKARFKGRRYQVVEQAFAVFPEKSGELTIHSPIFQGVVENDHYQGLNQILMDVQRPVKIHGNVLKIKIAPIPKSYLGDTWLPANKIQLSQTFQGLNAPLSIGEPVTRWVTIKATGLTAEQLPTLKFERLAFANVYAQKPSLKNSLKDGKVIGEKTIKITYIPNQEGALKLPKLSLTWWNTQTDKQELASIDQLSMPIGSAETKSSQSKTIDSPSSETNKPKQALSNAAPSLAHNQNNSHKPYAFSMPSKLSPRLLAPAFILLLVGFFLLHYLRSQNPRVDSDLSMQKNLNKALKAACLENDAKTAEKLVIRWARLHLDNNSLKLLSQVQSDLENTALVDAISALKKSLYSKGCDWDGRELWLALAAAKKTKTRTKKRTFKLPPLNPS